MSQPEDLSPVAYRAIIEGILHHADLGDLRKNQPDLLEQAYKACGIPTEVVRLDDRCRYSPGPAPSAAPNEEDPSLGPAESALISELDIGSPEPFCACGRRWSHCDGSRRRCLNRAQQS